MYQVEDEPMETIHLYVIREGDTRPSLMPVIISLLTLSILIAIDVLTPYQQPVHRASVRVPAVPSLTKTFRVSMNVIPTGMRTYPATTAHGTLTITNGSVIAQIIPAGFTVQNVATDRAVYIPAGSANGYGYARVSAHALMSGAVGNLPPLAINQVIGSSVYIRNLSAFTGGKDNYSVKYATDQDRQRALVQARDTLANASIGLRYPCTETVIYPSATVNLIVTWRCQFVTYHIPLYMHVSSVQLLGTHFLLSIWFVEYPKHIWVK